MTYDVESGTVTPSTCTSTSGDMCLKRRKINIVLTGERSADSSISATIVHQVAAKNDYLYAAP